MVCQDTQWRVKHVEMQHISSLAAAARSWYYSFLLQLFLTVALIVIIILPCDAEDTSPPEGFTGTNNSQEVSARKFMITAANPLAVRAGYAVLKEGGSAVDAAIAAQMVLNLVEPQSSGIGGGGFMLYWDNKAKRLSSYDGRETAPAAVDGSLFRGVDDVPLEWKEALVGGRSVGVPGLLRMLELVHREHGKLLWGRLFSDAIDLAEKGFVVSPRLSSLVESRFNPGLGRYDATWSYFFPEGKPVVAGSLLKNRPFAETLRRIALLGADTFYKGDIGLDVVKTVNGALDNPGIMTASDITGYQAKKREPVCSPYRDYMVCGMGPPSSGGVAVEQALSFLDRFDLASFKPLSLEAVHLVTQAEQLAFADRNSYLADPDFVMVPVKGLLDKSYLKERALLMGAGKRNGIATAGFPPRSAAFAPGLSPELPATSHISVVDADGNAVSMTSSIEMAFGSALMVRGFLLNNQLTDFSFQELADERPIANRVEGGKRPRSSMSPTMVFDKNGNLKLVIGSPGGSQIINYVVETIIAVLDWGMGIQEAISLPRYGNCNGDTYLEKGTEVERLVPILEKMGHKVMVTDLNSGLHGIIVNNRGLIGGADPRREGKVLGE
jgi:gamma-glutamyltranspeptidase / glutathione hydrolase